MNVADLLAADIASAQEAVTVAQQRLTEAEAAARAAREAAAANQQNATLEATAREKDGELAQRRDELKAAQDMLASRRDIHRRSWDQQGSDSASFFRFLDYVSPNFLPFLIGSVLVVAMIWILRSATGLDGADEASRSRSIIAVIFGGTTIAVALIITLVAMLRADVNNDERFRVGKEIFTALLGIFGTILGFYFSQSISSQPLPDKNGSQKAKADGEKATADDKGATPLSATTPSKADVAPSVPKTVTGDPTIAPPAGTVDQAKTGAGEPATESKGGSAETPKRE